MLQLSGGQGGDGGQSYRGQPSANHNSAAHLVLWSSYTGSVCLALHDTGEMFVLTSGENIILDRTLLMMNLRMTMSRFQTCPRLLSQVTTGSLLAWCCLQSRFHFRSTYQISLLLFQTVSYWTWPDHDWLTSKIINCEECWLLMSPCFVFLIVITTLTLERRDCSRSLQLDWVLLRIHNYTNQHQLIHHTPHYSGYQPELHFLTTVLLSDT